MEGYLEDVVFSSYKEFYEWMKVIMDERKVQEDGKFETFEIIDLD